MQDRPTRAVRSRSYEEWRRLHVPCRYYRLGPVERSDFTMFGYTIETDPEWQALIGQMVDDAEITFDTIGDLLRFYNIAFSPENLDVLHFHLNVMRVTCTEDQALESNITDQYKAVIKALEVLEENLPCIIDDAKHALRAASDPQIRDSFGDRERRMLNREAILNSRSLLYRQIRDAAPLFHKIGAGKRTAAWHDDAKMLRVILRNIATQAGRHAGFTSPETPFVRFIHDALNLAGISHGDDEKGPIAIAKMFQRDDARIAAAAPH